MWSDKGVDESVSARRGEEGLFREIKVCRGSGIVLEEKELNSKNNELLLEKGEGVSICLALDSWNESVSKSSF